MKSVLFKSVALGCILFDGHHEVNSKIALLAKRNVGSAGSSWTVFYTKLLRITSILLVGYVQSYTVLFYFYNIIHICEIKNIRCITVVIECQ